MKFIILLFSIFSIYSNEFEYKYTDFTKDCKNDPKVKDKDSDIPRICNGPLKFKVSIYYSACSEYISIYNDEISLLEFPEQKIASSDKKKLEWVIYKNEPIALIFRVDEYKILDDDPCNRKKTSDKLIIRGLNKFNSLDKEISGLNANEKARTIIKNFILQYK